MRSKSLQDQLSYGPRLLRADRAAAYLAMSQSHFLDLVKQGVLPKPVKLRGITAWDRWKLDSAVDAWVEQERPSSPRKLAYDAMGITPTEDEE